MPGAAARARASMPCARGMPCWRSRLHCDRQPLPILQQSSMRVAPGGRLREADEARRKRSCARRGSHQRRQTENRSHSAAQRHSRLAGMAAVRMRVRCGRAHDEAWGERGGRWPLHVRRACVGHERTAGPVGAAVNRAVGSQQRHCRGLGHDHRGVVAARERSQVRGRGVGRQSGNHRRTLFVVVIGEGTGRLFGLGSLPHEASKHNDESNEGNASYHTAGNGTDRSSRARRC